ncbi:LTA synthase family protein [uncultured Oscillibacter sp.]|uniref:LTA synthase family protein n=1 Tax=uncultured Oscillibacter sp. TaxID=876091 RepID=UPI00260A53B9|nr:sulfatase-like hydrolase/transferase [uncultured Oscillibacter sp.]
MFKKKLPIGPQWFRWLMSAAASLCMGLAVAVAMQWTGLGTLTLVWEWVRTYPAHLVMTALLYAVPVFLLGALTGRLWLGAVPVELLGMILALVDYFKNAVNGTPLELADFGLAAQAGNVAGLAGDLTPPEDFFLALAALGLCTAVLFLTRRLTRLEGRTRALSLVFSVTAAVILCTGPGTRTVGSWLGVDFYTRMPAAENRNVHGLTLSLWRDAFPQPKTPPEGYSEAYMQEVLDRIDRLLAEEQPRPETRPNILFILSESFYDLNRLPELRYGGDPLENFHALEKESISGTFHSHYLGYGTGYIEMAMLYGVDHMDLPPGTNICFMDDGVYERFDALAEQYTKSRGYTAEMLHAFDNSLYNRTVTYPLLGFDSLLFSEDVQSLGFDWEGGVYGGYYMKDSYLYQGMLERMEDINRQGKRAFLYGISMENHQPFDPEKFNYECQLSLTTDRFEAADRDVIRVMLEGITRADQALGYLTDALRESEEPTIVVFYGDHRPNLFLSGGDTVYTKLGLCPENDTQNWTTEQVNELYSTDYLIWANDAALLQGLAGTRRDSGVTSLGPQLLELTGGTVSRYWALLEQVSRECLVHTDLYFVDGEGRPSAGRETAALTPEARELLELRDAVIYDAIYGQQYITAAMNQPSGHG